MRTLVWTLFPFLLGFSSCVSQQAGQKIELRDSVHLLEQSGSPKCVVDVQMELPAQAYLKEPLTSLLKELAFHTDDRSLSLNQAARQWIDSSLITYRQLSQTYKNMLSEYGSAASFDHVKERKLSLLCASDNLLCFQLFSFAFEGGAHPQTSYLNICYDPRSAKMIKMADLFRQDRHSEIARLINLRLQDRKTRLFDEVPVFPNENFMIQRDGIEWLYNQYEIAPYSEGQIRVFVPLKELRAFLKPEALVYFGEPFRSISGKDQ